MNEDILLVYRTILDSNQTLVHWELAGLVNGRLAGTKGFRDLADITTFLVGQGLVRRNSFGQYTVYDHRGRLLRGDGWK